MKRISAAAVCVGLVTTSFALTPAASAAPKRPAIVHQGDGVRAAVAGELTASFTLAQTTAQRSLTKSLAGQRSARGRAASFAQTQPVAAHRDAVVQWAQANGFRVLHSSRFLVSVAGPSATLAAALGTTVHRVGSYTESISAPVVPTGLAGHASSVVGLDDRPVFRHHSVPFGPADVRAMSNNVVRNSSAGSGVTVGSVNFAPWVKSDLTDWAADPEADGDPSKVLTVAAGQITEIPIGGFDTVGDGTDPGSGEVDLDAEALLGAAPAAKQRLYFADNTAAGSLAVWDQMATDAANHLLQVATTSWGGCEPMFTSSELDNEAAAISNLVAAGVTLFAASGDAGAYDCSVDDPNGLGVDNTLAVDFPASDPIVVGVGGTSTQPGATPLTYTHQAWGPAVVNTAPDSTFQGAGSGGGFSSHFGKPTWQPVSATPGRQVPDIAGLGDPDTGYIGYLTADWDSNGSPFGDYSLLGGTSLAAPLAAAGLATLIGSVSPITALGNILPALYSTPAASHDVNGNGNGNYGATTGFDHVTGLGVVDWTALKSTLAIPDPSLTVSPYTRTATVPVTVGGTASSYTKWGIVEGTSASCPGPLSTPPTSATIAATEGSHALTLTALDTKGVCHKVTKSVVYDSVLPTVSGLKDTYTGTTTPRYSLSWASADAAPSSGLSSTHISVRDNTAAKAFYAVNSTGGSVALPTAAPGHSYTATLTSSDRAGNTSAPAVVSFRAPTDDVSLSYSGFVRQKNAADYLGSHGVGSRAGSYVKFVFTGKLAWIGMIKSRSCGYVDIYVDGVKRSRVNLYSATTKFRQQVRVATFSAAGQHSVTLRVVGAHQSGATGNNVYADSLTFA